MYHERVFREQMHVAEETAAVARDAAPETLFDVQQRVRKAAEAAQAAQVRMAQHYQHIAQAGDAAEPVAAATEKYHQKYHHFLQHQ